MAKLSNLFCLHYNFLLYADWYQHRLPIRNSGQVQGSLLGISGSQPPNNIRLATYLPTGFNRSLLESRSLINCQAKVIKVWAHPRSLATTYGIIGYFLFLGVLRCFSSPAYHNSALYIQAGVTRHNSCWVSPFGNLRIKAQLAAPRGLSQLHTSFIGILRQGILCARLSNFLRLWYLLLDTKCN